MGAFEGPGGLEVRLEDDGGHGRIGDIVPARDLDVAAGIYISSE